MEIDIVYTGPLEDHERNKHQPTPNRAKVQAVIEFNTAYKIKIWKTNVLYFFKVAECTG